MARGHPLAAVMVILHVAAPTDIGGLESVVIGLAAGHRGAGHQVHVAAVLDSAGSAGAFQSTLRDAGVAVHAIQVPRRGYRRERQLLGRVVRDIGADVVHTHGYRPDVVDAPVAWQTGIPTVSTLHGYSNAGLHGRLSEWFQNRAFRRFQAVVAVSRPLVERLRKGGVPSDRIHLVPNACGVRDTLLPPAQARRLLGAPSGRWHVGWVGRIEPVKGPDVFLEALAALGDLPLTASVVGDGSMRAGLEARTRYLGLAGRVRWHGALPGASRLFTGLDLLVLSSRMEGTPMVLLEAMAAELPVVATEVGGVPDVVTPREGYLVPPDDPFALAEAIRAALLDRPEARARAMAARRRAAEEFGAASWLGRYEHIYHEIRSPQSSRVP